MVGGLEGLGVRWLGLEGWGSGFGIELVLRVSVEGQRVRFGVRVGVQDQELGFRVRVTHSL